MALSKIHYDIKYVNLGYILSRIEGFSFSPANGCTLLGKDIGKKLKDKLEGDYLPKTNTELLVIDMDGIKPIWENQDDKPSWMQPIFEDIIKKEFIKSILFANCDEATATFLREKDFRLTDKVLFLDETENLTSCEKTKDDILREIKEKIFNVDIKTVGKVTNKVFIQGLIGQRIKEMLSNNECIKDITDIKNHELSSTPVHVNKYVNLKPLLEKHDCFQEVCYLLHRHIYNTFLAYPDYVVASSRNSIYIASGLLKYFKTVNMIIIDQVSPVTRLSNFSNLDDIKPNRKYAIIEDFCCMGTEIKTVKSVLWSRGVDVDQYCYSFPIVSH